MTTRAEQKEQSRQLILQSAAKLFRQKGVADTSVSDIMKDAGLTHGGFYAHFKNKDDLIRHGYSAAMDISREEWFKETELHSPEENLFLLINRYLSKDHRDHPERGCPMPALLGELANLDLAQDEVEAAFRKSVKRAQPSVGSGCEQDKEAETIAHFATMIGGILLSRSVSSPEYSENILKSCRDFLKQKTG